MASRDDPELMEKIDKLALEFFERWIVTVNRVGLEQGKREVNEKEKGLLEKGFLAGWWSNYLLSSDEAK